MPPRGQVKRPRSDSANRKDVKRARTSIITIKHDKVAGVVLTLGQGDTGQLGLGTDIFERRRPSKIDALDEAGVIGIAAGAMHTLCLTANGQIYSFGCNDEGALGRDTSVDGSEFSPAPVDLNVKAVQISAGDSHSAALTADGHVYAWGTFRDSIGQLGLIKENVIEKNPAQIAALTSVVKIASGNDHLVCLTDRGYVYSMGCAQQGQLGRLSHFSCSRDGRRGIKPFLEPKLVICKVSRRRVRFKDIWTGAYGTFAQEKQTDNIYACGLNNYWQLGIETNDDPPCCFMLAKVPTVERVAEISGGQHHTLALNQDGKVYSFGRQEYGRLGLPIQDNNPAMPAHVSSIDFRCKQVDAGNVVSYAVTNTGTIYSFGMGNNLQLSTNSDDPEDDVLVPSIMIGKQLENRECLSISSGGQHTVILAKNRNNKK